MKWCGLLLVLFMLCSCGTQSATHNAVENAKNSVTELENILPAECKPNYIKTQINTIRTQINAIEERCVAENEKLSAEKIKWKTAFFSLLVIIGVWVLRKVI